jgi:hypothetical protein
VHVGMDRTLALVVFLAVVALLGTQAAARYSPEMYYEGDCPYYISTTLSISHDFDIDLRDQLRGGLQVHGRQIALGEGGEWYPKHSLLMPVLALPFYALFGMPGFALFGVLVVGALAVVVFRLTRTFAPPLPAAAGALLMIGGTFLRRYDYNLTPDVLSALVAASALLAFLRGRDATGGSLLGIAVFAKPTNLFLLPFAWTYACLCRGRRGLGRSIAGSLGPVGLLLLLNLVLFGSPFTSSYDRNVLSRDGELTMVSHRGQFDESPLRGLLGEILDRDHGLIPTSPVLFLALPGFVLMYRRHRREAVLTLLLGEFYLLLFATYRYWNTTAYGNRFLILLLILAAPPTALALEWIAGRVKDGSVPSGSGDRMAAQSGS